MVQHLIHKISQFWPILGISGSSTPRMKVLSIWLRSPSDQNLPQFGPSWPAMTQIKYHRLFCLVQIKPQTFYWQSKLNLLWRYCGFYIEFLWSVNLEVLMYKKYWLNQTHRFICPILGFWTQCSLKNLELIWSKLVWANSKLPYIHFIF